MQRLWTTICLLLLTGLLTAAPASAQFSAIEVKAAFLFNFAKFTSWPDSHSPHDTDELVVGIMGEDPFGPALQRFRNQTVAGHHIRLNAVSTLEEARACHILFIAESEQTRLEAIFSQLQQAGVLTVSDIRGFASRGGMIELLMIDQRIRFTVNLAATREADLTLSSHLLNLARHIIMPEGEPL